MNSYELTVVLPGKATSAKVKDVNSRIEKLVSSNGGKIAATDEWGKKDLAYDIEGNSTGYFTCFTLKLPPEAVSQINDKLKLEDDIIRYLLVRGKEK